MHADIGDGSAWPHDVLAEHEAGWRSDRLDCAIHAAPAAQRHDVLHRVAILPVHRCSRAETLRNFQTAVVQVNHDELRRRIELRGQQGRESNRTSADDRHRITRCHLAIQHPALEAGRQDVAQHHQRLFIGAFRNTVEAGIGVGDAHVLRLSPIDGVAKNPAPRGAMGIHASPTIFTFSAGADAGNQDVLPRMKCVDRGAHFVHDAHPFVPENAPWRTRGHISPEDM